MSILLALPHQLCLSALLEVSRKHEAREIWLLEEPAFFYDPVHRPYRVNKAKCAFHRASMKAAAAELLATIRVEYVDCTAFPEAYARMAKKKRVLLVDPCDATVVSKYAALFGKKLEVVPDAHGFLATPEMLREFDEVHGKKDQISHASFFEFMKRRFGIMEGVASTDALNRGRHRGALPPRPPAYDGPFHREAIAYAEKNFAGHWGEAEAVLEYPVTRAQALEHLGAFLRDRFQLFGPYQDAVRKNSPVLFHAHISFLLNAGLLTPAEVLKAALECDVPQQSAEAFVRQVLGWREYMRYVYLFHGPIITRDNAWGNDRGVTRAFYVGETGVAALDAEIRKAVRTGYAHHIVRLMYFLNALLLARVSPANIVKWFMEVVSIDAYEWVMRSNVAVMGGFAERKRFARKPYVCSSNYWASMSDYAGRDETLDALFYAFLDDKRAVVQERAAVYMRNLAHFDRLPARERERVRRLAARFVEDKTVARTHDLRTTASGGGASTPAV